MSTPARSSLGTRASSSARRGANTADPRALGRSAEHVRAGDPQAATDIAFAERGRDLDSYLRVNAPEIGVTDIAQRSSPPPLPQANSGCGCSAGGSCGAPAMLALSLVLALRSEHCARRRRKSS